MQQTGVWPAALCESIVSLITKGEGTSPLKLRPIGVMSAVYRLWAACQVRRVMVWQESWIDPGLHGFRKAHSAEDVWWKQALEVEEALLHADSLFGLSLDYGKCFDRIPINIVLQLALQHHRRRASNLASLTVQCDWIPRNHLSWTRVPWVSFDC